MSHGSLFYRGEASYVVGQATADQLVLENHQFRGEIGFEDRLWTTSRQGAPGHISYPDASVVTGTLEASRTRSGGLARRRRRRGARAERLTALGGAASRAQRAVRVRASGAAPPYPCGVTAIPTLEQLHALGPLQQPTYPDCRGGRRCRRPAADRAAARLRG